MKNFILLILLGFLLNSCATLLNSKQMKIAVHSIPEGATLCLDADSSVRTPVCLEVPRSYHDFNLRVRNDSLVKTIRIKSRVSPEFKWGNLLLGYYCPLGYIIDATSREKMYGYDPAITIDLSDHYRDYTKWESPKKGRFYLRGSFPWFDFADYDNGRGFANYSSFMGLSGGLDYYHSDGSFLSLSGGATGISDLAFPVMDRWYPDTTETVSFFSALLTNNHDLDLFATDLISFTAGYGLSFSHFRYRQEAWDSVNMKSVELFKSSKSAIGFCLDLNLNLFKYTFIGLTYLPSCYTLSSRKWEYSALTYIDFGIRVPLGNYHKDPIRVYRYTPKLID